MRVRRPQANGRIVIVRPTGHPPVEQQLRGQVRSSSGMTWGVHTADGAKLGALSGRANAGLARDLSHVIQLVAEEPPPEKPDKARLDKALLAFLDRIEQSNAVLPGSNEIVRAVAGLRNAGHLLTVLNRLARAGKIFHWSDGSGNRGAHSAQRVVRLALSQTMLRTKGAPASVTV
jgi:hypothetical protein